MPQRNMSIFIYGTELGMLVNVVVLQYGRKSFVLIR